MPLQAGCRPGSSIAELRTIQDWYVRFGLAKAEGVDAVTAVPDSAVIDSGTRQVVLVAKGDGRFEPPP